MDHAKAREYYTKAADGGDADAQDRLGDGGRGDGARVLPKERKKPRIVTTPPFSKHVHYLFSFFFFPFVSSNLRFERIWLVGRELVGGNSAGIWDWNYMSSKFLGSLESALRSSG